MFISWPFNEKPITDAKSTLCPRPTPNTHDNEQQAFFVRVTSFINSLYTQSHAILHLGTDAAINLLL